MDNLIPDIYQKSIYDINYKKLKEMGIKCLIFDLNNTMVPTSMPVPDKQLKDLFAYLEGMNFKLIILSNQSRNRVAPFKEQLNVDASFKSHKPFKKKYQKILKLYRFEVHEVAAIGDELLKDILGANQMGLTSILVNPISNQEDFFTKLGRILERKFYASFQKKGLLKKGEYYE